jgi:solute carrier family 50 protein (sugar transporter)
MKLICDCKRRRGTTLSPSSSIERNILTLKQLLVVPLIAPQMKSTRLLLVLSVGPISILIPSYAWSPRSKPILRKGNHPTRPLANKFDPINNNMVNESMRIRGGGTSLEMTSNPLIASLIPRLGVITSTLLYFSPMSAVRAASRDGSLGDLNPIPLALMAVASMCWLVYGLSIRNPFVTLSNLPGAVAAIWYVTAVLPLLKGSQLETMQNTVVALSAITICLWTYLSLSDKPIAQVQSMLGLFASGLFIVLSGSPLSTIKTVLSTRNSGSILSSLTIAQVTNTAIWSAYGLAIKDKFVYGPNLTGLGFGLVQLVLKLAFPSK